MAKQLKLRKEFEGRADRERFCVVTLSSAGMPEPSASKLRRSAGISWSGVSTFSGRPAHRPFRGLLGVQSRDGLHTRAVAKS
jgi:hypothetical protein